MAVVPITGKFENWRAMLAHVMELDDLEHVVVLATHSNGATGHASFECTRGELAWFSLVLAEMAREE